MDYITKNIDGIELESLKRGALPELAELSRKAASDGAVLLKNENNALPFKKGEKISIFGATQLAYIKSGTGSGGRVNSPYETDIPSGLRRHVEINEELFEIYKSWWKENRDKSEYGWASQPWCNPEMPLDEKTACDAAKKSDAALIVIGRRAGENRDNSAEEGSYYLTSVEIEMMKTVRAAFDRVVVVLNVGNIIDMAWEKSVCPDAIMYVFQGGTEGGNAAADALCAVNGPNGRLTDTIAEKITDYPSDKYYYEQDKTYYGEDIYVGYRYFETFSPDSVMYPFGFGLSYTKFERNVNLVYEDKDSITVSVTVKNAGSFEGRDVVQVYFGAPQGKLGKPVKELVAFSKTETLSPGMSETILLDFKISDMASYDDSGVTGNANCYVLEAGDYIIYCGENVRDAAALYTHTEKECRVVSRHEELLSPVEKFKRLKPEFKDGAFVESSEDVPTRSYDLDARIAADIPEEIKQTGDRKIKLYDVAEGKATLDDFVAQLGDEELAVLCKGEGMNSPKVTAGCGCAYGGTNEKLNSYGIPAVCGTDGPSGVRMEDGSQATYIPGGTLLACTWDPDQVEKLHTYFGIEMFVNKIDTILAPGMNIHRHPLNGRNFEYYSEDPLLTGKMGAAATRGVAVTGATTTIKHFICNNRETNRYELDSIVSQRAIREIYAKGFEIAVKEGGARAVMTSYNPVNGIWTASNYDLCTMLLRREWGFDGFVMTDWWASVNGFAGDEPTGDKLAYMVRAQNDVYMVVADAITFPDDILSAMKEGRLPRGVVQRSVKNLLKYILSTPALVRESRGEGKKLLGLEKVADTLTPILDKDNPESGEETVVNLERNKTVLLRVTLTCDAPALVQENVTVMGGNTGLTTLCVHSTDGSDETFYREFATLGGDMPIRIIFPDTVKVKNISILA